MVWPDAFVSDNSLARAITQIRKALDDDPKAPKYIETVPTVGYRFVGEYEEEQSPVVESVPAAAPSRVDPYKWAALATATEVVMGLAVGGWWFYSRKAHGLTGKDTIVLADFANSTGDPVFDDALKQGLAVQLGQSPLLNILSEPRVRSALKEMTRSPDEPLTASLAREVCERTKSKAYIAGSIADLAGHYVIGLNAVHCATGDALAREQTEAADKQQVIAALGRGAERLRNKLGESLSSIQKFDVPLAQATTSSLEALKAYSLGLAKFAKAEPASAVHLFQQAIELDPEFAVAYANLGRAYQNLRQHDHMEDALRKAFVLRNRTCERERFDISSVYYQFVTNQVEEAIQTCELWAQTYPLDFTPHRILGYENQVLGRFDKSAEEFGKAQELDPSQAHPYAGLMMAYMALNRLSDARAVNQEAQARKLPFAQPYDLACLDGDTERMTKIVSSLASQPGFESRALSMESRTAAYFGRLGRAQALSQRAERASLDAGDRATAADIEAAAAFLEALFGNSAGARQHASAALSLAALSLGGQPSAALSPTGVPVQMTLALALAGESVLATNIVDRLASHTPPDGFAGRVWLPEIRAAVELKRGNSTRAVDLLAPVVPWEAGTYDQFLAAYLRGEAYLAGRRGQEAALEFQKIIDHRGLVLNSPIGALARLGVARSYALEGDTAKAGAAYKDFLALWKDADPEISILIAAKSEYAKLR